MRRWLPGWSNRFTRKAISTISPLSTTELSKADFQAVQPNIIRDMALRDSDFTDASSHELSRIHDLAPTIGHSGPCTKCYLRCQSPRARKNDAER